MAGRGENFICEAQRFGDRVWCGRCNLHAVEPDSLVCKTPAECGLTLAVLLDAVEDEAHRIDGSSRAAANVADQMIAQGRQVVPGPYRDRLRRAAELRAIGRLIERLQTDATIMERLKKGAAP